MKEIYIQFPTFEVVRNLDRELSNKIGSQFSTEGEQKRLVAILLALKEFSLVTAHQRGRELWFSFSPHENLSTDVLRIKLRESEKLRSIELSKLIAPILKQTWRPEMKPTVETY